MTLKKAYSLSAGAIQVATMADETHVQNKVKPKDPKKLSHHRPPY